MLLKPEHKSTSTSAKDVPLKLGDRVIFYDNTDEPVKGTIRWIGVNKAAKPGEDTVVGIEMVRMHVQLCF